MNGLGQKSTLISVPTLPQGRLKDKRAFCRVVPVAHIAFPCVYERPEGMALTMGDWVIVPLRHRDVMGIVWEEEADPEGLLRIRAVGKKLLLPSLPGAMLRFMERVARYNVVPLGRVLQMILGGVVLTDKKSPRSLLYHLSRSSLKGFKARTVGQKSLLRVCHHSPPLSLGELARKADVSVGVVRRFISKGFLVESSQEKNGSSREIRKQETLSSSPSSILSSQQRYAYDVMLANVDKPFVLEGVTGSGKTVVYMHVLASLLREGGQGLILMPEIALSEESLKIIKRLFPLNSCPVELWHSGLSPGERKDLWHRALRGENLCVIGTRSALFLPLSRLKGIVCDEEHDDHFKQEHHVLYNARDMGVLRGQQEGIPVILSTATPSLETFHNVQRKRYGHVLLKRRFSGVHLPEITVIDMRKEKMPSNRWLSRESIEALHEGYRLGEQSLVFLNRRGYAPMMLCKKCGYRYCCSSCDVFLVRHGRVLLCHHCGMRCDVPHICASCRCEGSLVSVGPGVERIAQEITTLFPQMRVVVLSSDVPRVEQRALIQHIQERKVDVVVGTQVIAKGYHFPFLTNVIVVDGDMGLKSPDLRAAEKTWQILQQVGGRAGREEKKGHVFIQTYVPEHEVIRSLASDEPSLFPKVEMQRRRRGLWPPFGVLIALIISGKKEKQVCLFGKQMFHVAPLSLSRETSSLRLLGPIEAPLYRLRDRYRVRFLIKGLRGETHAFLHRWLEKITIPSGVRLVVDVDPRSFL